MRFVLPLFLATAVLAVAQDAAVLDDREEVQNPTVLEKWDITLEQYLLIDPSRRPGGDTYQYWRERKRGPYGNLLERIPGGPRRPVRF